MDIRNAICFVGGIGTTKNSHNSIIEINNLIDYHSVAKINKKFIFDYNNNIDIFMHCWTPNVKNDMIQLYNPKSFLFEDNSIYKSELRDKCWHKNNLNLKQSGAYEFNRASFFLSIKKSLTLMNEYKIKNNIKYDKVMVYRPDIVINKPLVLNDFPVQENLVFCNDGVRHVGDFHYVMDESTSYKFSRLYDNIESGRLFTKGIYQPYDETLVNIRTMPVDVAKYIGIEVQQLSNFVAGRDQEVARKCKWNWRI